MITLTEYLTKQNKQLKIKKDTIAYTLFNSKYCAIPFPFSKNEFVYCYDLKTNKLIPNDKFNDYLCKYFEPMLNVVKTTKNIPNTDLKYYFSIGIESPCLLIRIEDSTFDYKKIRAYKIKNILKDGFHVAQYSRTHLYYPDTNSVYVAKDLGKYFPLNIKEPIDFIQNKKESILLDYPLLRQANDVLKHYKTYRNEFSKIPFSYNEILQAPKSNNRYLMTHHYKQVASHINWNKLRLNECVAFNQLVKHVSKKDFNNIYVDFLNNKKNYYHLMNKYDDFGGYFYTNIRNQYLNYYMMYLTRKLFSSNSQYDFEEILLRVSDYIKGLRRFPSIKLLPCNFNSLNRLQQEEHQLYERLHMYTTKTSNKILYTDKKHKWTKAINNLKTLPTVKILNTQTKLVTESRLQHNCVSSYEEKVAQGDSLIFHYDYTNGDSYTVEVAKQDTKYQIIQIYKKYNEEPDAEVTTFLTKILNRKIAN